MSKDNDDLSFIKEKISEKYNEKIIHEILSCENTKDGIDILKSVKDPSDKFYISLLSKNGSYLSAIKNPSFEIILVAVSNCPHSISCIKNPPIELLEKMKKELKNKINKL